MVVHFICGWMMLILGAPLIQGLVVVCSFFRCGAGNAYPLDGRDCWHSSLTIDNNNDYLLPTWAYKWYVVSEPPTDPVEAYKRYTNEFDTTTIDQVISSGAVNY